MIIKLHSNGLSDIMLYLGHVDFYTSVALKKIVKQEINYLYKVRLEHDNVVFLYS